MAIIRASERPNGSSFNISSVVRPSRGQCVRSADKNSSFDDPTESEPPVDADVEVCQVGENLCSLPLELCDLPDLKKVLSLETWNFCLTEEERESLVKFLPVTDAETYRVTLKELFNGEIFHFNRPLADLHEQIKGGHRHPQVVQYREVLRFLQRKEHHQRLRQYHNSMVNYCSEMKRVWQMCHDASLEEKIEIWNTWKSKKIMPSFSGSKYRTPRVKALLEKRTSFLKAKDQSQAAHFVSRRAENGIMRVASDGKIKKGSIGIDGIKTKKSGPKGLMKKALSHQVNTMMREEVTACAEEAFFSMNKVRLSPAANEHILRPLKGLAPIQDKVKFKIKSEKAPNDVDVKNKGTHEGSSSASVADTYHLSQDISLDDPMEESLDFVDDALIDVNGMNTDGFPLEDDLDSLPPNNNDRELSSIGTNNKVEDFGGFYARTTKQSKKRVALPENGFQLQLSMPDGGEASYDSNPRMKVSRKAISSLVPSVAAGFPFSVIHLLSSVKVALTANGSDQAPKLQVENENAHSEKSFSAFHPNSSVVANGQACHGEDSDAVNEQDGRSRLQAVPLRIILSRVKNNPGDPRILETQEPLQGLVCGVLKVLSSKTAQPAMKGWRPFVAYERETRGWLWIAPLPGIPSREVDISAEAWGISSKMLYKIQEMFCSWLKHEQEFLWQLGQLSFSPPPTMPLLDEKERFRDLRAQKSLITISPTSEEMRAYFRKEEALRYSVPERVFSYTAVDGHKSAVAPLRRIGGKPTSKARDHFMLKPDRPPHVTVLCLVRDAAARLPGSIGTRADVCSLIRDSQYIVEDVSEAQLNQVVSGALDRLHYERDPCVRFDGERKLWVYLHTDKDEEDFEDDATSSTKRWKRVRKEDVENMDVPFVQEYDYPVRDEQDSCSLGLDFSPSSCFAGSNDLYPSSGRAELVYMQSGAVASPPMIGSAYSSQGREDTLLPFIELPPSIQPPCVNMQQCHPMGWEVLGNRWERGAHVQRQDHIVDDDAGAARATPHPDTRVLMDRGIH